MGKRVLFVDDSESILFGYRQFCKKLFDDKWRFFYASDGAEAIEIIESYHVDMVVSDLDMPFYDGVHLMDYIVTQRPSIIRVIVSGTTSASRRQSVVRSVHQFYEKPGIPNELRDLFHRVLYLDTLLVSKEARTFIHGLGSLPVLPSVLRELQKECEDPNFSLHRCAEIVSSDLALSANLLRLVNSSFFDIPNRIESPEQAVMMLGLNVIKAFIVQHYLYEAFSGNSGAPISHEEFTRRSFRFAKIAKGLAKHEGESRSRQDRIYVTGLLHNIGELILNFKEPRRFSSVLKEVSEGQLSQIEVERSYFNCAHDEVGAYILGLWGFEQEILEAVVNHHTPSRGHSKSHDLLDYLYATEHILAQCEECVASTPPEDVEYVKKRDLSGKLKEWREISIFL